MQVVTLPRVKALNVAARGWEQFLKSLRAVEEGVVISPPVVGTDLIVLLPGHHPANFGRIREVRELEDTKYVVWIAPLNFGRYHLTVRLIETTNDPNELA